jgi:hypothetical protein
MGRLIEGDRVARRFLDLHFVNGSQFPEDVFVV